MSVRVNLLPDDLQRKEQANRRNLVIAGGFLGLVAVLVAGYLWQLDRVSDAQSALEEEEAVVQELQAEIGELNEFQELEARLASAHGTVAAASRDEIDVAGILQDLAVVMPSDTELSELSYAATPDSELGTFGELILTGRTLGRHAPGLERFLLELDKVGAFRAPYFGSAAVDNDEAVAFDVSVQLGPEVLTRRYANGIPEVLR